MNYVVVWKPEALDGLAAAWLTLDDKEAVNVAELEITRLLADNPYAAGSHVSEGLCRMTVSPLMAHYSIKQPLRTVEISQVDFLSAPGSA